MCDNFLAIDQLNPRSEEQQTAICQLLRTFEKGLEKSYLSSKPTDKCFKCGEEGHWAKECKKEIPHDSAWLQRQRCYTCGQYGHLKKDCELAITNCKLYRNMTPKVKGINIDHDPLTIQLLRLPEVKLKDHPKLVIIQLCDGSGIHPSERFLQGSDAWEEARKGKINGSWAACALGWRGRQEMMKYVQEVKTDQGTRDDINDAMCWGSMGNCEEELPKKPVGRLSVVCWPTVGRLSADCWPTVGRLSADRRPTGFPQNIDYQSADSRPTNDRQSADSW